MNFFLKVLFFSIAAALPAHGIYAQKCIHAAGGEAGGSGGSVSWSLGQVACSDWSDAGGIVTEGVQQPYEIFIMPGLQEFQSNPACLVFPNPTSGNLNLKILDPELKNISLRIYDTKGRQLRNLKVTAKETTIPMDDLKTNTYYLCIQEKDQPVMTYKILKK